ncbi:hypothetical protein [Alteromonas macleodii]|uniref:hypothetical protein n=1 Tax=Alteromonas macleodii TaxID=28108 RepID=UPI0031407362|tara:strand:+ start:189830 stop:190387 length:558 start_codon:yes stop_codon:yes gene_type:complete
MKGLSTELLYESANKLAVILTAWLVTEVEKEDVTVWDNVGHAPYFISFDPVVFRFLIRRAGEGVPPTEYPIGVQFIDLLALRDQAGYMCNGVSEEDPKFDRYMKELYVSSVLRFWLYDAHLALSLEKALMLITQSEAELCLDRIKLAYEHFGTKSKKGSVAEKIMSLLPTLRDEELDIYESRCVQ